MGESSPAPEPLCTVPCFRVMIRVLALLTSACLMLISGSGFSYVVPKANGVSDLQGATSFACMCFLGILFGFLLFLAEFFWEWYFFYFGFLRYRVGRAIMNLVGGTLTAIIGLSNAGSGGQGFVVVSIVGGCCIGVGVIHLMAIFITGNNAAPPPKPKDASGNRWFAASAKPAATEQPQQQQQPATSSSSRFGGFNLWNTGGWGGRGSNVPPPQPPQDVSVVPTAAVSQPAAPPKDRNLPSWMYPNP